MIFWSSIFLEEGCYSSSVISVDAGHKALILKLLYLIPFFGSRFGLNFCFESYFEDCIKPSKFSCFSASSYMLKSVSIRVCNGTYQTHIRLSMEQLHTNQMPKRSTKGRTFQQTTGGSSPIGRIKDANANSSSPS